MQAENPELLEKVSLFPVPGPTVERYPPQGFLGGGYFWTVGKDPDPERVEMSRKLVEFLSAIDNLTARVNTRPIFALPSRKTGFSHPEFLNSPLVKLYAEELETLRAIVLPYEYRLGLEAGLNPLSGIIEGSALFGDAIQRVATGTWTSRQAVEWINQQLTLLEATLR